MRPNRLIPVLLLFLLPFGSGTARAAYDSKVVVRTGQAHPSLPGEVLTVFNADAYALDDRGRILLAAKADGKPGYYMFEGETLRRIFQDGDPAPGHPGLTLPGPEFLGGVEGTVALAADGRLQFVARPTDPQLTQFYEPASFRLDPEPGSALLPHTLSGAGLGGSDDRLRSIIGYNGEWSLVHTIPAVDYATRGLAIESGAGSGAPDYQVIVEPTQQLRPTNFDIIVQTASGLALNDQGRAVYSLVAYDRDSGKTFTVLMVRDADGTTQEIADDQFGTNLLRPREVQIAADGTMGLKGWIPAFEEEGIFRLRTNPGGASAQVLVGGFAPGSGGGNFVTLGSWALVGEDTIYFVATVTDGRAGLWKADPQGIELVVISGDQIPDQPTGRRFGGDPGFGAVGFASVYANSSGGLFFTSRIQGRNAQFWWTGLFAIRGGQIETVMQCGDVVEGEVVDRISVTRSQYGFGSGAGAPGGNSTSGRQSPMNSRGDVVFDVETVDFNRFVILASPAILVNSTGDRPDADPADGVCSCDPLDQVPTGEDPECTLRAALEQANADQELDQIRFAIDEPTPWSIRPGTPLPTITSPVDLEGPVDDTGPLAPRPLVVIESGGAAGTGLHLAQEPGRGAVPSPSAVRNLALDLWETGLVVEQDGATVEGNWIGVDPWNLSETAVDQALHARGVQGLTVLHNRLDGSAAALWLDECQDGWVQSNRIGDGADDRVDQGTEQLSSTGILVTGGGAHQIGGQDFDEANVIAGVKIGVHLAGATRDNSVQGNRIGTDRFGHAVVPNGQTGIQITASSGNAIGAVTVQAGAYGGNVIVGSPWGIRVRGASSRFNTLSGNLLGALGDGTVDLDHGEVGIEVSQGAYRTRIGGSAGRNATAANLIQDYRLSALNSGGAILLRDDIQTDVIGNAIFDSDYGIDIAGSQTPVISANAIFDCFLAVRGQKGRIHRALIGANRIESNHVVGSGIIMDDGTGRIVGNSFDLAEYGVSVGTAASPVIQNNCFAAVGNEGIHSSGFRISPVNGERNWWGSLDGPSGAGSGSGVAVGVDVDFDPWLGAKDDYAFIVNDSLLVDLDPASGQPTELELWFGWGAFSPTTEDSVLVPVDVTDEQGWLESTGSQAPQRGVNALQVTLSPDDRGLGAGSVRLAVPADVPAGTSNLVEMRVDGVLVGSSRLVVGDRVLTSIELSSRKPKVAVNHAIDIQARGVDQTGNTMPFDAVWSAAAGTITADGRFTAPDQTGDVAITARDGSGLVEATIMITVTGTVDLDDPADGPPPRAPARLELAQNLPNPFNPSTVIGFALPADSRVRLDIYNVRGERVRSLIAGESLTAGQHERTWNGVDDRGHGVASGVYFYRLDTGSRALSKRMLLVK